MVYDLIASSKRQTSILFRHYMYKLGGGYRDYYDIATKTLWCVESDRHDDLIETKNRLQQGKK
jgi:hypothetical protein